MENFKKQLDLLSIENSLQKAEIKQLTFLVFELIHRLEQKDDQATRLKLQYAQSLKSEKMTQLDRLDGLVPSSDLTPAKFELHNVYNSLITSLKDQLENS
jgi:hypothetical protein